jgi:hypothetical protein
MPYSLRWNNPRYWHRRAEEVRTVGERMSNIEARTGMQRLASDYEVMAQRAQEWFDSSTNQYLRMVIMRMHPVPSMLSFALLIGIAASPVAARELEQKASYRTVTAFLTEHGRAATSTPRPQLVACKADGSACAADAECCSSVCKPVGEGRACVSK